MSTTPDYGEPWGYDIDYDMALTKNGSVCDANRAVACVNACAGMADPAAEIEAMREAIQEGHDALDTCIEFIKDAHIIEAQWDWEPVKKANAALAKLKPFIPDASPPKP